MGAASSTLSKPVTTKDTVDDQLLFGGVSIRFSGCSMQGWRKNMEDAMAHHCPDFDSHGLALYCVFDGHGGARTSQYSAEHFAPYLWNELKKNNGEVTQKVMTRAFLDFDWSLCTTPGEKQKHMSCGTTVSMCLIDVKKRKLYVCHCGDSRIIVFRPDRFKEPVYITRDHNPENETEFRRISSLVPNNQSVHTAVTLKSNRVFIGGCSSLNVCRGFGDHDFKRVHGVRQVDQAVSAVPDYFEMDIRPNDNVAIVLASDGIWNSRISRPDLAFLNDCNDINSQVVSWIVHDTLKAARMSDSIATCMDNLIASSPTDMGRSTDNMASYVIHIRSGV